MRLRGCGYLFKEGFRSIWANRMMSLASIGVLISCLLLTGAAILVSYNVTSLAEEIGSDNMVDVYLDDDIGELEAIMKLDTILSIENVSTAVFFSREDAIKDYEEYLGEWYKDLTGEGNPLPNAFKVTMDDLSKYEETVEAIMQVDGVQKVSDRSDIASKLTSINNLVTIMGFWLVVILGLISMFIISNTIRMTMYSRRFEISIMKSVGATNWFVRIPFLVEGMTIGFLSGTLTSLLLMVIYDIVAKAITNIASYLTAVPYSTVAMELSVGFVLAGMLIGALGSFLSMRKYLRKEGGEILGW